MIRASYNVSWFMLRRVRVVLSVAVKVARLVRRDWVLIALHWFLNRSRRRRNLINGIHYAIGRSQFRNLFDRKLSFSKVNIVIRVLMHMGKVNKDKLP